ncbi:unnamed protein product [Paramecium primaurelia]|uniref:Palmitoyltransferase n=1 Tax=Paramecium primaurelia TaxID=5886 RepID=A0A8S1JQQ7_PARPR|nr:unnamed protein product [Paramecium primaurelia]
MADDFIKINNEKQSLEQNEASDNNQQNKQEDNDVESNKKINQECDNVKEKENPIDLWEAIIQGNFDIIFSYEDILDYNSFGPQGFGIVHYLATQGQLEGLKLMKKRGANLDLLTQSKQNALAIACNFGFIDIAKYLIDQGCSLDNTNLSNMSPLSYAIKNKKYALIFYIITKGQFQNIQDTFGNSFVHFSAMENDVFMLQFYNAFQLEYNLFDKQGQTPLTKAINNCSIDSIKFLLRENPKLIEYALDLDVVNSNEKIKQLINQAKIQKMLQQYQIYQKIQTIIKTYQKYIVIGCLVLFIFFELILFIISEVQKTLNDGFLGLMFDISFIIGMLYLIFYVVWFMLKTTDNQNQGTKLIQKRMSELSEQNKNTSQINVDIKEEESKQTEIKQRQQKSSIRQQQLQSDEYMPLAGNMNLGQVQNEYEDAEVEMEEENEDNNQEEEEGLNEKQKFLKKYQKESQMKFNLYQNDMTPSFLEGITLKDFLQLNYKAVEDLIDQMHTKPSYYFKFANKINQFKQEINSLLEINDPLWYNGFTIIHIVYFLFETNRFKLLHRIDWNRICFTCLSYKLPRTFHCSSCNMCVKDYHLHSKFFGKCINSTNHFFYFLFVLSFTILIDFYLLFTFLHYYDKLNSLVIAIPNIFFLIDQYSRLQSIVFLINVGLSFILNFELLVEITCILNNMTRNELFNSNRYKYLYIPSVQSNGQAYMRYAKRFQHGISINLFNFIKNSFRNIKLL